MDQDCKEYGTVINQTSFHRTHIEDLTHYYSFNQSRLSVVIDLYKEIIGLLSKWLDLTGNEVILDPKYFVIKS